MADPAYRSSTTVTGNTSSTFTVNKPTGTVDGDMLVAFQVTYGMGTPPNAPTTPTGWTLLDNLTYNSNGRDFRVYTKIAASEGASWTFNNTSSMSPETNVYCVAISGPPATTPEGHQTASGASTPADAANYTSLNNNTLILSAWASQDFVTNIAPHASYTALGFISSTWSSLNVGYKTAASPGSVTNNTATVTGSFGTAWGAILVAIAPPASPPPPPPLAGPPYPGLPAAVLTM